MTAGENYITLPNFLIPYREGGVEDYADAPETVGKIVLAVASKLFKGADISPNLSPCERGVYRHWLKVAEDGLEKAMRERAKCKGAAAARWGKATGNEKPQTANPSESVAPVVGTVAPVAAANPKTPASPPATVAPVSSEPQRRYIVAPVARPNPSAAQERRGGSKSFADCVGDLSGMFGGAGLSLADRIGGDPVGAGLEIINETGSELARNALKKLVRDKGAAAVSDTVYAFLSEIKNGEEPKNRGAALFARLRKLPNISAGR